MREGLEGETYAGRYVVADARLASPVAAGEGTVVVSPKGFVLFGPLPGDRWIIFVDIDEAHAGIADPPTSDTVAALVNERLGTDVGVHDVCWTSHFRMHRRMAPLLADGRRFFIGDAGHLSSPIAGEGLNAALMDAADLAWKLAASWAVSQRRMGCLAMPSYVARPHVLADEFVPGYLGDSFGLLPFVHGDPLANQFDSPFLVRLIRKEVAHVRHETTRVRHAARQRCGGVAAGGVDTALLARGDLFDICCSASDDFIEPAPTAVNSGDLLNVGLRLFRARLPSRCAGMARGRF